MGIRDGVGDLQGVEAPIHLVSAQKDARNEYKPLEFTKRRGSTRAGEERAQRKVGEDTIDLKRESPWDRKVPGHRSRSTG